jgi:hypothetical protein
LLYAFKGDEEKSRVGDAIKEAETGHKEEPAYGYEKPISSAQI